MQLPKLSPGKRFTLPRPVGSADALLLARLGEREKAAGRVTAIVTADGAEHPLDGAFVAIGTAGAADFAAKIGVAVEGEDIA